MNKRATAARRHRLRALILTVSLLTYFNSSAEQSGPKPMRIQKKTDDWFLSYTRQLPPPGLLMVMATGAGECRVNVTGSLAGLLVERPQIGEYRCPVSPERLLVLRELLQRAADEAQHSAEVMTLGTPLISFGMGVGDSIRQAGSVALNEPLPAAAHRMDDGILALAKECLEHPYRTLSGAATWESTEVTTQPVLRVALRLWNSGQTPVKLHNPTAFGKQSLGLRLQLIEQNGGAGGELQDAAFDITANDLAKDTAKQWTEPTITVEPGAELLLHIVLRRTIFLSKTRYRGQILFDSQQSGSGKPVDPAISGRLIIPLGELSVRRDARISG